MKDRPISKDLVTVFNHPSGYWSDYRIFMKKDKMLPLTKNLQKH